MTTSMYWLSFNSAGTRARSVVRTICTVLGSSPEAVSASAIASPIARLVWNDSFPPRRMHALPLLRHRAAASLVTFGRAS